MPEYSIASNGRLWHVMKNGRFFCMASTKEMAEGIIASLGTAATPKVTEFRAWHVAIGADAQSAQK